MRGAAKSVPDDPVIGAGFRPGGIQRHLGMELYDRWGRWSLLGQHRVRDNDVYYQRAAANSSGHLRHDVPSVCAAPVLVFRSDFELEETPMYTRQLNRDYFGGKVTNVRLAPESLWRPRVR